MIKIALNQLRILPLTPGKKINENCMVYTIKIVSGLRTRQSNLPYVRTYFFKIERFINIIRQRIYKIIYIRDETKDMRSIH